MKLHPLDFGSDVESNLLGLYSWQANTACSFNKSCSPSGHHRHPSTNATPSFLLHTTCCRPSCLQKSAEALTDMSATAEQTQGQSQNYQIPVRNPLWIPTAALLHHKSAAPSLALTNVCAVPGKHDALGCRSTRGIWDAQGTSTALSPVK